MEAYLVRHGSALDSQVHPQRPLSEKGRREVEALAKVLAQKGIQPFYIYHSEKERAKETAEILGQYLEPSEGVHQVDYLSPSSPPQHWENELLLATEPIMLVGHLPHLLELLQRLIGPEALEVTFFPATCVCLSLSSENPKLEWVLHAHEALEELGEN